jgi:hypothetical protein
MMPKDNSILESIYESKIDSIIKDSIIDESIYRSKQPESIKDSIYKSNISDIKESIIQNS